jgi:hypothetical protein
MVSNEESKVAFNHLGGFYFRDIKAGVSFKPMIENKRFIANTIRKGLKKT